VGEGDLLWFGANNIETVVTGESVRSEDELDTLRVGWENTGQSSRRTGLQRDGAPRGSLLPCGEKPLPCLWGVGVISDRDLPGGVITLLR